MTARMLALVRAEPGTTAASKVTGIVAEAAVFSSGTAVLQWLTEPHATEFCPDEAAMRAVREASGRSRFCELSASADNLAEIQDQAGELVRMSGSWVPGEDGWLSQEPAATAVRQLIARAHAAGVAGIARQVDGLLADFRDDLISFSPLLDELAKLARAVKNCTRSST